LRRKFFPKDAEHFFSAELKSPLLHRL